MNMDQETAGAEEFKGIEIDLDNPEP